MINWDAIDTVLLDMDGTLLDLHFDNFFWLNHLPKRYSELTGTPLCDANTQLKGIIQSQEGTLNWYCLDYWSDTLGINVSAIKAEIKDRIQVRPYVHDFLQRLQAMGKKVVLITNAHPDGLWLKLEATQIDKNLDVVISSHQFGAPKESQDFWTALAALENFDPARTLFIDDTVRILDSAKHFGIQHLLCIHQPDSRIPRRIDSYPAIDHFDEILPPLAS